MEGASAQSTEGAAAHEALLSAVCRPGGSEVHWRGSEPFFKLQYPSHLPSKQATRPDHLL